MSPSSGGRRDWPGLTGATDSLPILALSFRRNPLPSHPSDSLSCRSRAQAVAAPAASTLCGPDLVHVEAVDPHAPAAPPAALRSAPHAALDVVEVLRPLPRRRPSAPGRGTRRHSRGLREAGGELTLPRRLTVPRRIRRQSRATARVRLLFVSVSRYYPTPHSPAPTGHSLLRGHRPQQNTAQTHTNRPSSSHKPQRDSPPQVSLQAPIAFPLARGATATRLRGRWPLA